MNELKPLKGVQLSLNEKALGWLHARIEEVWDIYSDESHDENPTEVLDALLDECEWPSKSEDKYGRKVFIGMPWSSPEGAASELRVTVVLTPKAELKLDIRLWGSY